jgi:hypothetical protein
LQNQVVEVKKTSEKEPNEAPFFFPGRFFPLSHDRAGWSGSITGM